MISTPMKDSQMTELVYKNYKLRVGDRDLSADLILLNMFDFDVILGMDWLAANHVVLDCYAKTITFSLPEKYVVKFNVKK